MAGKAYTLFRNETTNTTSPIFTLGSAGDRHVFLNGEFDNGTVTLEIESPNFEGEWMPVSDGAFTEPMVWIYLKVRDNANIRAVITGAGGSLSVTVEISK